MGVRKLKGVGVLSDGTVVAGDFNEYVELAKKGKAIYVGKVRALCGSAGE